MACSCSQRQVISAQACSCMGKDRPSRIHLIARLAAIAGQYQTLVCSFIFSLHLTVFAAAVPWYADINVASVEVLQNLLEMEQVQKKFGRLALLGVFTRISFAAPCPANFAIKLQILRTNSKANVEEEQNFRHSERSQSLECRLARPRLPKKKVYAARRKG